MFLIARLVACTSFDEFEQLFTALCMICLAKNIYPEIVQYISKVQKAINFNEDDIDDVFEYVAELDEELTNDMGDSNSYKSKSPFGRYFNNVLVTCQERIKHLEIQHESTFEDNEYFLPRLPTFLATHYIPICPLWTSLILGPVLVPNESNVRSSNAIVENWMRILKINILQNQTKLRVGDFLRKTREGLEGGIRAFGFAFEPLSSKILKPKSIPSKIKDDKLAEEIWQRRRKNKTTYFATNNSQVTGLLKQKETNVGRNRKYTQKAEILQPVGKNLGIQRNPINKKARKSAIRKRSLSSLRKKYDSAPLIESLINDEFSSEDSFLLDNTRLEVVYYDHGIFSPVSKIWQREKCKFLQLTYVCGVLYDNESADKTLQIRELRPSKEKRISPDGNCLFRSISYVITGSDHNHQEIRDILVQNMRGNYREECNKYCYEENDKLLLSGGCNTIEQHIQRSKMDHTGSWGTDLELFLVAKLLKTDIFVYRDSESSWMKFSGHGFVNRHDSHPLTELRIYLRLFMDHYQPVLKVSSNWNPGSEQRHENKL